MYELDSYRKRMPMFCEEVMRQVCVPETHPKYQDYINDAIWKYMLGDILVESLKPFVDISGKTILDIGAGAGGISTAFAKRGGLVTAIDVDEGFERLSKIGYQENNVSVNSIIFDGTQYPFENESFDIICCFNIYEHVPDVNNLFKNMERLLKHNGFILGRMDYKWNIKNIKKDPHYGLPLIILLPRWLRKIFVIKLFQRSNQVEDYTWASDFKKIRKFSQRFNMEAVRYNDQNNKLDDNLIIRKVNSRGEHVQEGNRELLMNHPYCFNGFYNVENWDGDSVRWSKNKCSLKLINICHIKKVQFETLSIDEKRIEISINHGDTIAVMVHSFWEEVVLDISDENAFELNINIRTNNTLVSGDLRKLGIALRKIKIVFG